MDFKDAAVRIADAYMKRNPACKTDFKAFYSGGIRRGSDYRYEADFNVLFPEAKNGDTAEAVCAYIAAEDSSIGMNVTLFGPLEVRTDEGVVFKSDIFTERNNHTDNRFFVRVKKGVNIFRFIFRKTVLGFGGRFGTHLAKWDYIFYDPENLCCEGVRYRLNGGEWLPRYEEAEPEKIQGYALFYSKTEDGKDVFIKKDEVSFPEDKGYKNPFGISGFGAWVALWPLHEEHETDFLKPTENTYWRFKYKDVWLRPYYKESNYGRWNYPLGVTLYGLMEAADTLGDERIAAYAKGHIKMAVDTFPYAMWDKEHHGGAASLHNLLSSIDSLDDCGAFCAAVEEAQIRYGIDADKICDFVADYIGCRQPRTDDGAFCRQNQLHSFHNDTVWLDDLYMSVPFLVRRYKLTGEEKYLNDAVNQFICYYRRMRMENGLMSHVFDLRHNVRTSVAWGRGNGWFLFSLSELLEYMPKAHPQRQIIEEMFSSSAHVYAKYQSPDGRWRQVIDEDDAYHETSVTAMFSAAFARGAALGLLDKSFLKRAETGILAVIENCVDKDGNLYGVCRGSEFSFSSMYYKHELLPRDNDNHGIGIVLIAICEVIKCLPRQN